MDLSMFGINIFYFVNGEGVLSYLSFVLLSLCT